MFGPDKQGKLLKESRLMQVSEFNTMVNSLQRFKEDLAVKALTGKKNIRGQQTPDRIFFSVLEKMLLEVASSDKDTSLKTAEQQLLSLRKVYLWFESNKRVLVKSDGYFQSARKITEDIYEKRNKSRVRKNVTFHHHAKNINPRKFILKTIDVHLNKLHKAEDDLESRLMTSEGSMFARSPTQDLTSVDSATIRDGEFYEEDLDFAREVFEHEYMGGNKIERLNRPMTAPPKLKRGADFKKANQDIEQISVVDLGSPQVGTARPQSAINHIKHDLSWAKLSPTPLSLLIRKKAEEASKKDDDKEKKKIHVKIPSETPDQFSQEYPLNLSQQEITDPERIAKLVMFKDFCLEHATQQEIYMQQYTHHKHGTRQHFLEFPENNTESVVRETAGSLYTNSEKSVAEVKLLEKPVKMEAYKGLSLEEFLNQHCEHPVEVKQSKTKENCKEQEPANSKVFTPSKPFLMHDNAGFTETGNTSNIDRLTLPHPPRKKRMQIIQPSQDAVKVSSVFHLATSTGKRMNTASEQALSAPKHGWRYPMVPVASGESSESVESKASGVVLALQENDIVQHKVLIPLTSSGKKFTENEQLSAIKLEQAVLQGAQSEPITSLLDVPADTGDVRPHSSYSTVAAGENSLASRASSRVMSTPRYMTEVRAIYRQFTAGAQPVSSGFIQPELSRQEPPLHSLRSAGTSGGFNRPRTAASWGSYPAHSEVSRQSGAASHHSTGFLRHRSVAETMRVRSVMKRQTRQNSGRSSASSYVAQLREKKRSGANVQHCARSHTGLKKKFDLKPSSTMEEDYAELQPQLSFVSIVSPMHVPANITASAYAPPGGVYCGTTAAVALATENPTSHMVDDVISNGQLSYEDYYLEGQAHKDDESDANDDKWFSQWLSGGPLEGLHEASGTGRATTYADLVSRAAILDSSDGRTYSDDVPSSTDAMGLNISSPKEDFSISPRSNPLTSFRTFDEDISKDESDDGSRADDTFLVRTSVSGDNNSYLSSARTSASLRITDEEQEDKDEGSLSYIEDEMDLTEEEREPDGENEAKSLMRSNAKKGKENESDQEEAETSLDNEENNEDISNEQLVKLDDDEISDESGLEQTSESSVESTVENDDDSNHPDQVNDNDSCGNTTATFQVSPLCENDSLSQGLPEQSEEQLNAEKGVVTTTDAEDGEYNTELSKDLQITSAKNSQEVVNGDSAEIKIVENNDPDHVAEQAVIQQSKLPMNVNVTEETEATLEQQSTAEVLEDNKMTSSESLSETTTESLSESERELLVSENCSVKIVITSAKKVEKELKASKPKLVKVFATSASEGDSIANVNPDALKSELVLRDTTIKENINVSEPCKQENIKEEAKKNHDAVVNFDSLDSDCKIIQLKNSTTVDNEQYDPCSRIITFEEVSAVAAMSRPKSGRPIPCEATISDPFVNMVASTRQRQVERNVNVQTIFRGTITGDPYKKFDPEQRKIREEEQEAVVKMQRAFRRHLSRTRAARKFTGLSKESQDWAQSYKKMLMEKQEMRKRRMREARYSARSFKRKDAQRMKNIGPHTDVYKVYHPKPILPNAELIQESAIEIQRYVRGWLVRQKLNRVRKLITKHDSTIVDMVGEYRKLLERTQRRHGELQPSIELTYEEFENYLQERAKYELAFKKREFWQEMETSELSSFFGDCGLFPSQDEISEAWESVNKSLDHGQKKRKKHSATGMTFEDVMDVAFYIYVPTGARMLSEKKSRVAGQ